MMYKIIDKGNPARIVVDELFDDSEEVQQALVDHINASIEAEVLNFEMELFEREFEEYKIIEVKV